MFRQVAKPQGVATAAAHERHRYEVPTPIPLPEPLVKLPRLFDTQRDRVTDAAGPRLVSHAKPRKELPERLARRQPGEAGDHAAPVGDPA